MVSTMYQTFQDLILTRLEKIESIPAAMVGDPLIGKHLLLASELLESDELAQLYEIIGLSVEQRNRFLSAYTLSAFQSLHTS